MKNYLKKILCFLTIFVFIFTITSQTFAVSIWDYLFGGNQSQGSDENGSNNKITFKDVAGLSEEKKELQEIADFLKDPNKINKISAMGIRIPKGVLLSGSPGTGKTLLAKALANEVGVNFFSMSGSEFVEMYVGVGASRVRGLFNQARYYSPSIIFIDEIDAIGAKRQSINSGAEAEHNQTLNQLLVEMDGIKSNNNVIVIGATNRVEMLDPALLRPGRFDRKIEIGLPRVKDREEILKVHSKNKILGKDVDLAKIARDTTGFSGADLENLLNEAAILAFRKNEDQITMNDIKEAKVKLIVGLKQKGTVLTDQEKKLVSYHEIGHAIIARILYGANKVNRVSIIPTGSALGYTYYSAENNVHYTKSDLIKKIQVLLGGRVAVEIVFGDSDAGASNDLTRANEIATYMVTQLGMSEEYKNIIFNDKDNVLVYKEVKLIIDNSYKEVLNILNSNINKLNKIAQDLLEKETLEETEFEDLFQSS